MNVRLHAMRVQFQLSGCLAVITLLALVFAGAMRDRETHGYFRAFDDDSGSLIGVVEEAVPPAFAAIVLLWRRQEAAGVYAWVLLAAGSGWLANCFWHAVYGPFLLGAPPVFAAAFVIAPTMTLARALLQQFEALVFGAGLLGAYWSGGLLHTLFYYCTAIW